MERISYGLLVILLIIGVAINVIWHTGYGYIPLGIYVLLWIIGMVRVFFKRR